jgi:hypothetical protein
MVLLPNVPYLRSSQRPLTKVHQIRAARCAFAKEEEPQRPKGGALTPNAARRDVHPPLGRWQDEVFFPCRRLLFLTVNRKDIMPFARHNDVATPSLMKTFSAFLRPIPSISGQRKRGHLNPFVMQCSFELFQHDNESIRFCGMITALFRAKQQLERSCYRMNSSHNAESILTSNDFMIATTLPMPGTAQELSEAIHDTVVNR